MALLRAEMMSARWRSGAKEECDGRERRWMVIARAQPQRWMVLAGWLLAGGRVGWRAGWLWRMRRPRESRRSQVAGRKSQVAGRKSQVAGTVWREVVKDPTSFIRPALGTHPPKSRLLIIYLPGG